MAKDSRLLLDKPPCRGHEAPEYSKGKASRLSGLSCPFYCGPWCGTFTNARVRFVSFTVLFTPARELLELLAASVEIKSQKWIDQLCTPKTKPHKDISKDQTVSQSIRIYYSWENPQPISNPLRTSPISVSGYWTRTASNPAVVWQKDLLGSFDKLQQRAPSSLRLILLKTLPSNEKVNVNFLVH
ncbi:hypothetical protein CEXT_744611 [Caerostris extrusa]|uniref:Uncharacterized protein n=1 Tax=Caerostris extrusa TaxID=172846 RepID=A0AAV4MJD0_CAEEX|nr:hypothetical protein CEXT_744611 [Caerostris extrusa]